jgi:hypothetical protein
MAVDCLDRLTVLAVRSSCPVDRPCRWAGADSSPPSARKRATSMNNVRHCRTRFTEVMPRSQPRQWPRRKFSQRSHAGRKWITEAAGSWAWSACSCPEASTCATQLDSAMAGILTLSRRAGEWRTRSRRIQTCRRWTDPASGGRARTATARRPSWVPLTGIGRCCHGSSPGVDLCSGS